MEIKREPLWIVVEKGPKFVRNWEIKSRKNGGGRSGPFRLIGKKGRQFLIPRFWVGWRAAGSNCRSAVGLRFLKNLP